MNFPLAAAFFLPRIPATTRSAFAIPGLCEYNVVNTHFGGFHMLSEYLMIGEITKPQGVRGEVKVRPCTCDPDRYEGLETV